MRPDSMGIEAPGLRDILKIKLVNITVTLSFVSYSRKLLTPRKEL